MKIVEVTENNIPAYNPPLYITPEMIKGNPKLGIPKTTLSAIKVAGTDAEGLSHAGYPIKGNLVVVGEYATWEQQKQAKHFYMKLPSGIFQRVDDKKFSTAVVNAMNAANRSPGVIDTIKNKVSNVFNPDDPESDAYDILSREKNAGFNTQTDKFSTAAIKLATGADKKVFRPARKGLYKGINYVANKVNNKLRQKNK